MRKLFYLNRELDNELSRAKNYNLPANLENLIENTKRISLHQSCYKDQEELRKRIKIVRHVIKAFQNTDVHQEARRV